MQDNRHSALRFAAIASLGGFLFGFDASVISGVVGFIGPEFGLDEWQIGLVVGAPTLGGIIAALSGTLLADWLGRKRMLQILALLYTVSAVASALATDYGMLVLARFIGGLAFASLPIAPMYIGEIAPPADRGRLVSVNQLNIVIGFAAAYLVNYLVLLASQSGAVWVQALAVDTEAWRWMLGVEALPALVWLLALGLIPESPRWLVMRGRSQQASAVLGRLRSPGQVAAELREIEGSLGGARKRLAGRARELLGPSLRLPLAIGIVVALAQQVTGVNAIYFYAPTIFEQSGVGTNAAFAQATLIGVVNVVVTLLVMTLIDRVGRKPLMLIGLAGVVLSTAAAGYGFHRATYELTDAGVAGLVVELDRERLRPLIGVEYDSDLAYKQALREAVGADVVREHAASLVQAAIHIDARLVLAAILGFVASFALSLGPVTWCLLSEIFPNRVRGPALALVGFFNALASFGVQLLFPWELSRLGPSVTFLIYAALGALALGLVAWLLPETRGKSLEALEAALAPRRPGGLASPAEP